MASSWANSSKNWASTDFFQDKMNRFLHKKKANAQGASADDSVATSQAKESRWKKAKKIPAAPRPQLNLAGALPPSDDFRTSLIMPNLSARFSMLREQDDPKSKLGKARDDSVLSPTRQSRLMEYGYQPSGLSGIAEVSSVKDSQRPTLPTDYSFTPGDDKVELSRNGSMMGRARPGEGNTLFGGRQKVYKVPGSMLTGLPRSGTSSSLGKVVYEDDVHVSAFQEQRQLYDEETPAVQDKHEIVELVESIVKTTNEVSVEPAEPLEQRTSEDSTQQEDSQSTPSSHRTRPSADSSNTSVPSQADSSTTATSTVSPTMVPAASATKESSVASGGPLLERSLTKRRLYEQGLDQHLYDQQTSALSRLNSIHKLRAYNGTKSPPPLLHIKSAGNLQERSYQPYAVRPLSPTANPPLTTFGSIRRNGSDSPSPALPPSPMSPFFNDFDEFGMLSSSLEPADRGKATAMGAFNKPKQRFDEQQYLERQLQMQQANAAPFRKSSDSPATSRPDAQRTFLADPSQSDEDEKDEEQPKKSNLGLSSIPPSQSIRSPVSEHPALRNHGFDFSEIVEEPEEDDEHFEGASSPTVAGLAISAAKSDTDTSYSALHPVTALGGLIHQHLRNPSNVSSIYTPGTPPQARHSRKRSDQSALYPSVLNKDPSMSSLSDNTLRPALKTCNSMDRPPLSTAPSDPWDLDDLDRSYYDDADENKNPDSATYNSIASPQGLMPAPLKANSGARNFSAPNRILENTGANSQHTRDTSTATQQERKAFASELVARQRAIQENLANMVGGQNHRGNAKLSPGGVMKPFNMLRPSPSKESMIKQDPLSTRGVKSPGLGAGKWSHGQNDRDQRAAMPLRLREQRGPLARETKASSERQDRRPGESRTVNAGNSKLPNGRSASPYSTARSGLAASDERSQSRAGGQGVNVAHAMRDGFASRGHGPPGKSSNAHQHKSPRPSGDAFPAQQARGEPRGGFRSDKKNGLSDTKAVQPMSTARSTSDSMPTTLSQPTNTSSLGDSSRSSPPPTLHSAVSMPQPSASSTPVTPGTMVPPAMPASLHDQLLRKKTVAKSDISEPTLISSTSNVDTVDLPPGASLKNGMDEPPPLPPVNPRRWRTQKLFGMGRSVSAGERSEKSAGSDTATAAPPIPAFSSNRVRSPEPRDEKSSKEHLLLHQQSINSLGQNSSGRPSPRMMRSQESFQTMPSIALQKQPVMNEGGMF